jgi:hypothetical protein
VKPALVWTEITDRHHVAGDYSVDFRDRLWWATLLNRRTGAVRPLGEAMYINLAKDACERHWQEAP